MTIQDKTKSLYECKFLTDCAYDNENEDFINEAHYDSNIPIMQKHNISGSNARLYFDIINDIGCDITHTVKLLTVEQKIEIKLYITELLIKFPGYQKESNMIMSL